MKLTEIIEACTVMPELQTPGASAVIASLISKCSAAEQCADMPVHVGFTQTEKVTAANGTVTNFAELIQSGHGNVFAYMITVLSDTFADVALCDLTLLNDSFTFLDAEPLMNSSTFYQNGTTVRARGFVMKAKSRFSGSVENTGANDVDLSITFFFSKRNTAGRGNN